MRSEDLDAARPYAAYVRVRPWRRSRFDIQAGRIPPTFGAFGRRAYGADNPVIGYPLAYQYLTSLRPDAVPATADDLLRMRARGWRSSFPVGSPRAGARGPLCRAFRWDTGVQVRWRGEPARSDRRRHQRHAVRTRGSATTTAASRSPARVAARPVAGLIIGASAARGAWLAAA